MSAPDIVIETIGGNCPVQAEGTVNGVPFYFRARGAAWALHVGHDPLAEDAWLYREPYGEWPAAGWMTETDARAFVEACPGTRPLAAQ
jgi:hypothetical protein